MAEATSLAPHETTSSVRELKRMNDRSVSLKREINQVQPKIASLPPETLTTIFEVLCPHVDLKTKYGLSPDFEEPRRGEHAVERQFILSAVCSHWRQIVVSTPRLWTSLRITLTRSNTDVWDRFFTNSSPLPMSLEIEQTPASTLARPLTQNAPRIRELYIDELTLGWQRHISRMPNLHQLVVDGVRHDELALSINNLSDLKFLFLDSLQQPLSLSSSGITVVHLASVSAEVAVELLTSLVTLTEFRLRGVEDTILEDFEPPHEPFILPHLTHFEWVPYTPGYSTDDSLALFIRMPALRHLTWGEWSNEVEVDEDGGPRREFLHRLPVTMIGLDMVSPSDPWTEPWIIDFLNHLPKDSNIEHLRITHFLPSTLFVVCEALTPIDGSSIKLPKLKLITLAGTRLECINDRCREHILTMLEARCLHHKRLKSDGREEGEPFLKFEGPREMTSIWNDRDRGKIQELATLGVKITPV